MIGVPRRRRVGGLIRPERVAGQRAGGARSGRPSADAITAEVMDGSGILGSQINPFRFSDYERWSGEAWDEIRLGVLGKDEHVAHHRSFWVLVLRASERTLGSDAGC